ncbi:hypothetical protein E2C01_009693 [Portunus trituberculatus]|uniref:Uncharacterized protein n=1 Tax=Portunus trituberculatus TaxID=210409 RepID=A0A5B7D6P7_PORTR|nr:hypothetical protein [Portunus trituberculatus]
MKLMVSVFPAVCTPLYDLLRGATHLELSHCTREGASTIRGGLRARRCGSLGRGGNLGRGRRLRGGAGRSCRHRCSGGGVWGGCGHRAAAAPCKVPQSSHSGLESSVVITGHFILDIIAPHVSIAVILARTADQSAIKDMWVWVWTGEIIPRTRFRRVLARTAGVMWPLRRIVAETHDEAAARGPQHVVNLLLAKCPVLFALDSQWTVGGREQEEGRGRLAGRRRRPIR